MIERKGGIGWWVHQWNCTVPSQRARQDLRFWKLHPLQTLLPEVSVPLKRLKRQNTRPFVFVAMHCGPGDNLPADLCQEGVATISICAGARTSCARQCWVNGTAMGRVRDRGARMNEQQCPWHGEVAPLLTCTSVSCFSLNNSEICLPPLKKSIMIPKCCQCFASWPFWVRFYIRTSHVSSKANIAHTVSLTPFWFTYPSFFLILFQKWDWHTSNDACRSE